MNQSEFMDLLRYYFRKADEASVREILADYESHFAEGKQAGLTEEAIAKELGSPKAIYEMYLHEGMIEEKNGSDVLAAQAEDLAGKAGKIAAAGAEKIADSAGELAAAAQQTWQDHVRPQMPEAMSTALSVLFRMVYFLCYAASALVFLFTAIIVYVLSGVFPLFAGLSPLPGLSFLTVAGFGGSGFFAGLSLFFIARKIQSYYHSRKNPPAPHNGHDEAQKSGHSDSSADAKGTSAPITLAPAEKEAFL